MDSVQASVPTLELDDAAGQPELVDPFGRAITYLHVCVTDRCDFRCVYCMSENMHFCRSPACPICGEHRTITKLIDYEEFCGIRGEETPVAVTTGIPEVTPRELKARLDRGDNLFILDVREPHEYQICNLKGYLIPLGDLPKRVSELDSSREIVAHCRSGKRSADAVEFLQKAGFRKIWNLKGGILAWSDEVDPSVPKY